jgi:hypothetical protein
MDDEGCPNPRSANFTEGPIWNGEGYGNRVALFRMNHPIRTLLYEMLVEPLLRFLQRMLGSST